MNEQEVTAALLNAPIAGESLTAEMGAFPWQRPPELTTVNETVSFYFEKIGEDKTSAGFVALMDSGISIKTLVDTIIDASIINGIHTIDVGALVSPVLVEMFMYLGDVAKIEYTTGLEDDGRNKIVEKAMALKSMKEFAKKVKDVETPEEVTESPEELMGTPSKGLMSRPTPMPDTNMPMASPEQEQPVDQGVM